MSHDIFLSHASEDKETFVEKLYKKLTEAKYKIWYDKQELYWGDNLKVKIREGLKASDYGIVVISNNYFAKHKEWTFMEFNQILENEKMLAILHGIDMQTFRNRYPKEHEQIKNWMAISSDEGIDNIVRHAKIKIDKLKSEKDIDYTRLRDLLAAKKWKEADQETYRVMIKAVGKEDGDYFDEDEFLNFPCTELRIINGLWVKYSNGRFGFSVQKEIYLSVGGKADGKYYQKAWEKFGDRVGWRVASSWISCSEVTFDTSAPRGHLPVWGLESEMGSYPSILTNWEKVGLAINAVLRPSFWKVLYVIYIGLKEDSLRNRWREIETKKLFKRGCSLLSHQDL
ncbi:MAG: GUN4 domain-containing protein [Tolypothrix brevis GSE-NOS-MK-07-07A]|jgi:hypothetical protein|nr:GUN4 domain-containing protein [Tolypothrix brevis GSE-NOS-MK-07-07A]